MRRVTHLHGSAHFTIPLNMEDITDTNLAHAKRVCKDFEVKNLGEQEDITDANFAHPKRVCKDFEIKNLGGYHDLYVQSNTLFLADIFENFRNIFINMHKLDSAKFLSARGLAWQAALKKTKVKLDLLSEINMLSMVEKGIKQ